MITPSNEQAAAIRAINNWYPRARRHGANQVFRLFGCAGVGKSTVLQLALNELGLAQHHPNAPGVVTATFTGKAALVLRRLGTAAQTIHSLIYKAIDADEDEMGELEQAIAIAEAQLADLVDSKKVAAKELIMSLKSRIAVLSRPRFVLNDMSDAADCELIVLDEVSMVDEQMARDLLSFDKPVLVLGDPGQLPPIRGEGYFTNAEPDVLLTEIHRQAWDSPIIRLATMAREGRTIDFGSYDGLAVKIPKSKLTAAKMVRADQVICGRNDTRRSLNNAMRAEVGLADHILPKTGDKIICLRNRNDLGLINGMFLQLTNIRDDDDLTFSAHITDDEGTPIGAPDKRGRLPRYDIYRGHFEDHVDFDEDRMARDWRTVRSVIEATLGYAITCHKAQGSQWQNVIVVDDGLGRTEEDRRRWLYTAITRAMNGLVIAA